MLVLSCDHAAHSLDRSVIMYITWIQVSKILNKHDKNCLKVSSTASKARHIRTTYAHLVI